MSSPLKKRRGGTDPCSTPTGLPVAVTKVTHFLSSASKSPVGTGGGHRFGGQGELWGNRLAERREHAGKQAAMKSGGTWEIISREKQEVRKADA